MILRSPCLVEWWILGCFSKFLEYYKSFPAPNLNELSQFLAPHLKVQKFGCGVKSKFERSATHLWKSSARACMFCIIYMQGIFHLIVSITTSCIVLGTNNIYNHNTFPNSFSNSIASAFTHDVWSVFCVCGLWYGVGKRDGVSKGVKS